MEISIRETNLNDVERVGIWYLQFYPELNENIGFGLCLSDPSPDPADEMKWFLEFQKSCTEGNAVGIVAEMQDEIVGFCEVNRRRPKSPSSHRGGLTISVKKNFRDKGIATVLLEKMIECCKGKFEILELEVFAKNKAAKHLYEKFGFKAYGLRPQSVKRNGQYFDEELMYRKL